MRYKKSKISLLGFAALLLAGCDIFSGEESDYQLVKEGEQYFVSTHLVRTDSSLSPDDPLYFSSVSALSFYACSASDLSACGVEDNGEGSRKCQFSPAENNLVKCPVQKFVERNIQFNIHAFKTAADGKKEQIAFSMFLRRQTFNPWDGFSLCIKKYEPLSGGGWGVKTKLIPGAPHWNEPYQGLKFKIRPVSPDTVPEGNYKFLSKCSAPSEENDFEIQCMLETNNDASQRRPEQVRDAYNYLLVDPENEFSIVLVEQAEGTHETPYPDVTQVLAESRRLKISEAMAAKDNSELHCPEDPPPPAASAAAAAPAPAPNPNPNPNSTTPPPGGGDGGGGNGGGANGAHQCAAVPNLDQCCDSTTGQIVDLKSGEICDPTTGHPIPNPSADPCAEVSCNSGMHCDSTTKQCVSDGGPDSPGTGKGDGNPPADPPPDPEKKKEGFLCSLTADADFDWTALFPIFAAIVGMIVSRTVLRNSGC